MRPTIIAAGLLLTLAGWTGAQQTQTEPQPCRIESSPPTLQDLPRAWSAS